MSKDDSIYLQHILESIGKIERYTADGHAAFSADDRTQDAVLRNLQTLSESTQRLTNALKEKHPDVAWTNIAGFRNVAVHNYLGIDWNVIWDIVEKDLPPLKTQIIEILNSLEA